MVQPGKTNMAATGTSPQTGRDDPQMWISCDADPPATPSELTYHLLGGQIAAGGAPLAAAATCFHLHRSYDKNVETQKGWWWLMTYCHKL